MTSEHRPPRLRDAGRRVGREPYPLNEIPDAVVLRVAEHLTYLLATGRGDVGGDDWGDAFAHAIGGDHLARPVGIADVVWSGMAWSTKTVKVTGSAGPHHATRVRLISGRNSPDYSMGITDPHVDIAATGRAVLSIWNERVSIAQDQYRPVRTIVLARSADLLSYAMFEEENHRFVTSDYAWSVNANGNLQGAHRESGAVRFTWQPHGSQFTIHTPVPSTARRFTLTRPPAMQMREVLDSIGYADAWVALTPTRDPADPPARGDDELGPEPLEFF